MERKIIYIILKFIEVSTEALASELKDGRDNQLYTLMFKEIWPEGLAYELEYRRDNHLYTLIFKE